MLRLAVVRRLAFTADHEAWTYAVDGAHYDTSPLQTLFLDSCLGIFVLDAQRRVSHVHGHSVECMTQGEVLHNGHSSPAGASPPRPKSELTRLDASRRARIPAGNREG